MRPKENSKHVMSREKNGPIRTTFMELIEELSNLTRDDALVLAAVRNIFGTYRVRLGHTMAPVLLVSAQRPISRSKHQRGQGLPGWA